MGYPARFRVWRGDASGGELRDFQVEANEGEVVLDVIHRLQATQTPDLAVRWNCKAGKCGSCSAEINGRPRLMCMTRMSIFDESETITVTPLRTFPVIRDLVTDVSFNYVKAREIPSFTPPAGLAPGDYRMQQVDVGRSQEFRKCIECFLCQDVCHVIRDHEANKPAFAGPRFFIRLAELDMHPLDTADRKDLAQEDLGLGLCNITKCCTEVCPEGIKITDNGIIPMKERVVDRRYDPLVWLGSRIPRRPADGRRDAHGGADAAAAEQAARSRLEHHPKDRRALTELRDALTAQGRFGEALEPSRQLVAHPPRARSARLAAHNDHAWVLLCAAEAGQAPVRRVVDEAATSLESAQRLVDSGTLLSSTHALLAAVEQRWEDAIAHARDSRTWERGERERSVDLLTIARAHAATGRADLCRAELDEARELWPGNPRIAAVSRRVEASGDGSAEPAAPGEGAHDR
jgi:succinate dehydrogenase / fumarate reductase iron-sulfur subunit